MIFGPLFAVAVLILVGCIVYCQHVQNKCCWNDDEDKHDSLEEGQTDELLTNNNFLVQPQVPENDNRVIQDPPVMVVATCETGKANKAGCFQVPVRIFIIAIFHS